MELIVVISFPLVWVLAYKYFSKTRGKIISHVFGFIVGIVAFFILTVVLIPSPSPEAIKEKKQKEIESKLEIEQIKQKKLEENQKIELAEQKKLEENQKTEQEEQKVIESNMEIEKIKQSIAYDNTIKVIASLKKNYNIKAKTSVDMSLSKEICYHDKLCEIYVNDIQIQFMHKFVDVNESLKVSPSVYQTTCSAVLIGLTDMNKDLAENIIYQYFNFAAINGEAVNEIAKVKITVKKGPSNLLKCEFITY